VTQSGSIEAAINNNRLFLKVQERVQEFKRGGWRAKEREREMREGERGRTIWKGRKTDRLTHRDWLQTDRH
jgi:3-methyladenine DNA glycosylase Tag